MSTKANTVLMLCGDNKLYQLGEKSNVNNYYQSIICPPIISHIDISEILSYSIYSNHAVWYDNYKGLYIIANQNNQNKGKQSKPNFKNEKQVLFIDNYKNERKVLSVVCGVNYTLYLYSISYFDDSKSIAYSYGCLPDDCIIYPKINGNPPEAIFGGSCSAAAIDIKGGIILFPSYYLKNKKQIIDSFFLPNHEKAVNIACLKELYYILGESGRVYKCNNNVSEFKKLSNYVIVYISGTYEHCLAVSREGLVFKIDSNSKVEVISSLNKYKIVRAYAGFNHSLFQTEEGMILSCGSNDHGQLVLNEKNYKIEEPTETIVKSGASFCIAGFNLSAIFIGPQIPKYMPNMNVIFKKRSSSAMVPKPPIKLDKQPKDEIAKSKEEITEPKDEITKPKEEIDEKDQEILRLQQTIENLKKQKDIQKKQIDKLQAENKKLIDQLKKIDNDTKKTTDAITQTIEIVKKDKNKEKILDIIDEKDFLKLIKQKEIGHGATSTVYKVIQGDFYAMKIMNIDMCQKEVNVMTNKSTNNEDYSDNDELSCEIELDMDKIRRFYNEYLLINQLNHQHIIKAFGFFYGNKKNPPSILLEYCPRTLKKYIHNLNDSDRKRIIIEICDAMKEVHKAGLIHRDLKPENILLDSKKSVKISDFGLCTLISNDTETLSRTQMAGTLMFMAPEIIQGKKDYDEKVDIYAFGVVVYFIVTKGEYPMFNISDVVKGKPIEIPKTFTSFMQKLLYKCLSHSAKDRPSFNDLYKILKKNEDGLL